MNKYEAQEVRKLAEEYGVELTATLQVASPGKFEGESGLTLLAYDALMNGGGDDEFGSCENVGYFWSVTHWTRKGTRRRYYKETPSGFVCRITREEFKAEQLAEVKAYREQEEQDAA